MFDRFILHSSRSLYMSAHVQQTRERARSRPYISYRTMQHAVFATVLRAATVGGRGGLARLRNG